MEDEFDDLLKRSTFRVTAGGQQASGFAVSSALLVTSRHAVGDLPLGAAVTIASAVDGAERTAHVSALYPPEVPFGLAPDAAQNWPDVAILELDDDQEPLPVAVVLDGGQPSPSDPVRTAGFHAQAYVSFNIQEFRVGASGNGPAMKPYTRIGGDVVAAGMSGSAVITAAGTVCGILTASRSDDGLAGGFFIPLVEVIALDERLRELHEDPDATAAPWTSAIGAARLAAAGRDAQGKRDGMPPRRPRMLDLGVRETRSSDGDREWSIVAREFPDEQVAWRVPDIGDDLLDALDSWSRRDQLHTREQVQILSRVLGRVILPEPIRARLDALDRREPPLVRLRIAADDRLTGIPWEYATPLATSTEWSFSRYLPIEKPPLAIGRRMRVLVLVDPVDGIDDPGDLALRLHHDFELIEDEKAYTIEGERLIDATVVELPSWTDFVTELRRPEGWDVVHLVASASRDGAIVLRTDTSDADHVDWDTICTMLVSTRASTVVLHLGSLRFQPAAELSTFLNILEERAIVSQRPGESVEVGDVRALVLARHVTTPAHVLGFSKSFYRSLSRGLSVERAVQLTRSELLQLGPAPVLHPNQRDHAAFGAVSVITTAEGDVRLLAPPPAGVTAAPPTPAKPTAVKKGGGQTFRSEPPGKRVAR